jgi:uncharacterized membrane protein (DUF106 family)
MPSLAGDEEDEEVQQLVAELCRWVQMEQQRRDGTELQERIAEAERQGDTERLMALLQEKQDLKRKKAHFFI